LKRYAIISCVRETLYKPERYPFKATEAVYRVANSIYNWVENKFDASNISIFGPNATKKSILDKINEIQETLDDDGLLFFYFHGHGDTTIGENSNQFLICRRGILIDNTIDLKLSGFLPTQRVLSIVDSCSSETVVEWKRYHWRSYPQVIHIASALDKDVAFSDGNGGVFSQMILNDFFSTGLFFGATYYDFLEFLRNSTDIKNYIRMTKSVDSNFLNKTFFD
jgi:hypothetical protein